MRLAIPDITPGDWQSVRIALQKLASLRLGSEATPTWDSIKLTGLTASRLMQTDANKTLSSVSNLTNWVAGTSGILSVADDGDGSITLNISDLSDPGADRIPFWDETNNKITWASVIGNGLTLSGTNLYWAWLNMESLSDSPDDKSMMVYKGVSGGMEWKVGSDLRDEIGLGTGDSPQFTAIELGHANDTTIARSGAGRISVEGTGVMLVGDAPTAHTHDTDTLQLDGVNSDGGAFSFTTSGAVTFSQAIASANFAATNKLTACATNAGALDFSAAAKTLTVEDSAIVSQDYSSDASPTFGGLNIIDSTNVLLYVTHNSNQSKVGIGTNDPDVANTGASTSLLGIQGEIEGEVWQASELALMNYQATTTGSIGMIRFANRNGTDDAVAQAYIWCRCDGTVDSTHLRFYTEETGSTPVEKMRISSGGNIGIGEIAPVTLTEWTSAAPYLTLHNSEHEDVDGGRESRIIARGEQSGEEESVLGYMEFSHDGAADDQKGQFRLYLNDGDDDTTPTLALTVASDAAITAVGSITSSNFAATNKLTACATNAGALDFSAAGKTLTVEDDAVVSQDYSSDGTPTFGNLALSGAQNIGLDLSGGTWAISDINLTADPIINENGSFLIRSESTSAYNLFIGKNAFSGVPGGISQARNDGTYNICLGFEAGYNNDAGAVGTSGRRNVYIGYLAGYGNAGGSEGYENIAIGAYALQDITTAINSVCIGYAAGANITTGGGNACIGSLAGNALTTQANNFFFGNNSGHSATGSNNLGIGQSSLYYVSGTENVGIGGSSGGNLTSGNYNVYIGSSAGGYNQTGGGNICIGYNSGGGNTGAVNSNEHNIFIGESAGQVLTTGQKNTVIGQGAGYALTSGSYNVFIGRIAGWKQSTNSNLLLIDNQDRGSVAGELAGSLLYGVFNAATASQSITINGDLNIRHHLAGIPDEITATSEGVAASLDRLNTEVTTNGDEDLDNVTLANGTSGQIKHIYCVVAGHANDTWKITPATMIGGNQITFSGAGEGCTLVYADNEGWCIIANNGGTIS